MSLLLPIALRVEGRRCLVVGAGSVAARRVRYLLEAAANVVVVAPNACPEIDDLARDGRIELIDGSYGDAHLFGALLVIAATNLHEVNRQVCRDASEAGVLCCDAETHELGDFVVPSVVRRGDLCMSVTTGGASPALAARIASELQLLYGAEYAEYLQVLREAREEAVRSIPDPAVRREALRWLIEDDRVLEMVRAGRGHEARRKALSCISSQAD
jgi:precorrin-2 dehydrogenase / sirohydrochlorin ferrochelatase